LRALPIPKNPHGRAWRAAELIREHRGDGHIAACVSTGLDAVEMNVLTEVWLGYSIGEYSSTRHFSEARIETAAHSLRGRGWLSDAGTLTEHGLAARHEIERATDKSQDLLIAALGDGIDEVILAADDMSRRILPAHAAPADPRKRAAG
jgi:hypothetical protein